jgi:hypothetical protein
MNDSRLDFDLKRLSERSIPELPENFHALVGREFTRQNLSPFKKNGWTDWLLRF